MSFAAVSTHHGVIVRAAALVEAGLSRADLVALMEVGQPLAETPELLSFGPHFGAEAAETLCTRLAQAGLTYVDDYFVVALDHPDWCEFGARAAGRQT